MNGVAADLQVEINRYENLLREQGPIDLQLLGLGRNGHIGFNEPGSSFGSRTRAEVLTESTRKDDRRPRTHEPARIDLAEAPTGSYYSRFRGGPRALKLKSSPIGCAIR